MSSSAIQHIALPAAFRDPVTGLPSDLTTLIFLLVPVDTRLRSIEVSPAWRAFLCEKSLWHVCDLSDSSGVARRTPAMLRAASECAQGTLRVLDLSGWPFGDDQQANPFYEEVEGEDGAFIVSLKYLMPILTSNSSSLSELRAGGSVQLEVDVIEGILAAAPHLRLLECDTSLYHEEARGPKPRLLEATANDPNFAPLRLLRLEIYAEDEQPPLDVQALAVWAAKHASLLSLSLSFVPLDSVPTLGAVVDLAISQLQSLSLSACGLSPASLPALTRMLMTSNALLSLHLSISRLPLLTGADVPAFCAALRSSRLVELSLNSMHLWESLEDGLAVFAACAKHPTLRKLRLTFNQTDEGPAPSAVGAALAMLIVDDSVLESLDVSYCYLGDAAIRILFAAVAGSTRLCKLSCSDNNIDVECARESILPAVQANTSLRELYFGDPNIPELEQAEALVHARA
jgi:hypothetical protein